MELTINVTKEQLEYLLTESSKLGITKEELIQQLIDIQMDVQFDLEADVWN